MDDAAWIDIERALAAVILGELEAPVARERIAVVVAANPGLDRARLGRVHDHIDEAAQPFPPFLILLHRLRNRLAGVMTNVELVEMVLRDAGDTLSPAQRDDVLTALAHARRSGRDLADTLRDLAPPADASRAKSGARSG